MGPGSPRQQVLFIAGAGRSGSTLAERVLARLPGMAALGEVRYVWDRAVLDNQSCGCGLPFADCPFWTEVGRSAFGRWDPGLARRIVATRDEYDRARHVPALLLRPERVPWAHSVRQYADAMAAIYRSAAAVAGVPWVIDSSKHVSLPYILSLAPGVDLTVLHVVRDPRGVAYSWSKDVVRPEITDRVEYMPRYGIASVARTWLVHNGAVAPVGRRGVRVCRVRYEDFVTRPDHAVRAVAGLTGLQVPAPLAEDLRRGEVDLGVDHTVAGNPLRFRTGPLTLRPDVAWRDALSARDRTLIATLTAPMMMRYGYTLRHLRS